MAENQKKNRKRPLNGKPFPKGVSGNPKGRPKKDFCIPDILRKLSSEKDDETKRTKLELICIRAIDDAIGGDNNARAWVADRMEGKALERVINQELGTDEVIIE